MMVELVVPASFEVIRLQTDGHHSEIVSMLEGGRKASPSQAITLAYRSLANEHCNMVWLSV